MDFALTDIQSQFRATLRRFAAERPAPDARDDPRAAVRLWRTTGWAELAGLGALGALLPEAYDGLGGDSIDAMVIAEEIGRALAPAPIIETVVVAAGLIGRLGSEAQKQRWLPAIAGGRIKFAFADGGFRTEGERSSFEAVHDAASGRIRIDGRQDMVSTDDGEQLLVLAATRNAPGHTLFCLRPDHPGLRIRPYRTIDDRPAATVEIDALQPGPDDRIGPVGGADAAAAEMLDHAVAAQCAEAIGIMASLLNQTIAHLRTRTQFGQALAGFQALQHRLADMVLAYELALSLTCKAAILCRDGSGNERPMAVSAAKVQVTEAARRIGHEAIQMHGAIGMTLELPVGRAVKRLKAMEPAFGSADYHLRRYGDLRRGQNA
jgi:alkylation response protein AidB-like acyl-CoA dehydrogenase